VKSKPAQSRRLGTVWSYLWTIPHSRCWYYRKEMYPKCFSRSDPSTADQEVSGEILTWRTGGSYLIDGARCPLRGWGGPSNTHCDKNKEGEEHQPCLAHDGKLQWWHKSRSKLFSGVMKENCYPKSYCSHLLRGSIISCWMGDLPSVYGPPWYLSQFNNKGTTFPFRSFTHPGSRTLCCGGSQ